MKAQQRFGNEWINYSQTYLKINIAESGFYKIALNDLQKAGLSVSNPNKIQIFYRGQEISIKQNQDFIEFYGLKNDGSQDSLLYRPYSARANSYQSLYPEISSYFITVGQANGKKIGLPLNLSSAGLTAEKYHLEEKLQVYNSEYSFNNFPGPVPNLQQSYYENGEGWTGGMIRSDSVATWKINLENLLVGTDFPKPRLSIQINGRSDFAHIPKAFVNNSVFNSFNFNGYKFQNAETELPATNNFELKLASTLKDDYEIYSLSYYKVVYPQSFNMVGQTSKLFYLTQNTVGKSLLKIDNIVSNASVYDLTDVQNIIQYQIVNGAIVVNNTKTNRKIWVTNAISTQISTFENIKFENIDASQTNYVIVSHSSLTAGAETYSAYRSTKIGGNYRTKVFDIQALYNQFSYGEHHPMAIRRFADFMTSKGQTPYLFLIGRPYTFPDFLKTTTDDLVPSIGYPGSDALLTAGLNGSHQDVSALPTGRLSVTRNDQILTYLDKVKEFEDPNTNGLWRKNLLHLNGGKSANEIESFRNSLVEAGKKTNIEWIGARVGAVSKQSPVEVENTNISKQVNEGVSMISFFGHSSPTITDFNFGFASTVGNGLSNKGKYPFMYFIGCAIGNVFFRYNTLPTDWLLTPNKGAIALIAPSYWSFSGAANTHLNTFYDKTFTNKTLIGQSIGKIHQEVNKSLSLSADKDEYLRSSLHQAVLQGDPALVIYPLSKPDFQLFNKGIVVQSKIASTNLAQSDSVKVGVIVNNIGLYDPTLRVSLKAIITATDNSETEKTIKISSVAYQDTVFITLKAGKAIKKITVVADSEKSIDELDENNNSASLDVDWEKVKSQIFYPENIVPDKLSPIIDIVFDKKHIENGEIVSANPTIDIVLADENELSKTDSSLVDVYLKKCEKCNYERVNYALLKLNSTTLNQIVLTLNLKQLKPETYSILVTGKDKANNKAVNVEKVFKVTNDFKSISSIVYPNPASDFIVFEIKNEAQAAPKSIQIQLYSLNGQLLLENIFSSTVGKNKYILETDSLPAGVLVYKIIKTWQDGKQESETGKLVLVK